MPHCCFNCKTKDDIDIVWYQYLRDEVHIQYECTKCKEKWYEFENRTDARKILKEHYDKCSKLLNDGYNIVFKQVDYNDSTFDSIIRNLANTDGIVQIIADE